MENQDEDKFLSKQKRVKDSFRKLKKIFNGLTENKKKVTETLLQNVAFMAVELEDLQEDIQMNGATEVYNNGRQVCTKATASMQVYNATLKSYNTSLKIMLGELSSEDKRLAESALAGFL